VAQGVEAFDRRLAAQEHALRSAVPDSIINLPFAEHDHRLHLLFILCDGAITLHESVQYLPPHTRAPPRIPPTATAAANRSALACSGRP